MDFKLEKIKVSQGAPIKILLAIKDIDGNWKTAADYTAISMTLKERDECDPRKYNDMESLTAVDIPLSCILSSRKTYNQTDYNFEFEPDPSLPELFPKRKWSYIIHLEFAISGKRPSVWEIECLTN